jgi:hypothetical protein
MKGKNKFLAAAVFSLLSFGVVAGESYTCALDAKKTKGWIPSTIKISFNDDKQLTKLYSADYAYDYDLEIVKILRYTKDFREVKYISQHQTAKAGTKYRAIHTITILPKLNNKISYMLKFSAYSNHYNARGTCKKTELTKTKTKTKTSSACPANMNTCGNDFVCRRAAPVISGKATWVTNNSYGTFKYVTEAKKRGLSCGVVSSNSKAVKKNTSDVDMAFKKLNGYGVAKDLKGAFKLFLTAAKQGDSNAQNWLGKMYHQGNGAIKNYKKAYMWFNIANANGYTTAGSARDLVGQSMSSSDISAAQDTSSACIESEYVDC